MRHWQYGGYSNCQWAFPHSIAALVTAVVTSSGSTTAGSTDYSITCTVTLTGLTGTPTIEWMNPGVMVISSDTDFTLGPVTGSGTTYSRELMFNSLTTSLAGKYTCSASLGSVSDMATTTVNATSMCLPICVAQRAKNGSYVCMCIYMYGFKQREMVVLWYSSLCFMATVTVPAWILIHSVLPSTSSQSNCGCDC